MPDGPEMCGGRVTVSAGSYSTVFGSTFRSRPVCLTTAFGQTVDRRHLRAGVGRGHGDDRHRALEGDGFAEADRGAAANRHTAIGLEAPRHVARGARRLDRHVHHGLGINADRHAAQTPGGFVGVPPLSRRREDEGAAGTETADFLGETIEGAGAEDHAGGGLVVEKRAHAAAHNIRSTSRNRSRTIRFFLGDPCEPPIGPGTSQEQTPGLLTSCSNADAAGDGCWRS